MLIIKKKTKNYNTKKIYKIFSTIKEASIDKNTIIKYIKNTNTINKSNLVFFSINNIYTLVSEKLINKNLIFRDVLQTNSLFFNNYSAKKVITSFLDTINYPLISKFKIEGRVFRVKKKTNNLLLCQLNYSHKIYFLKEVPLSYYKIKTKKGRLLFIYLLNFSFKKLLYLFNKKLRSRNIYTKKGLTNKNQLIYVRKRPSSTKK